MDILKDIENQIAAVARPSTIKSIRVKRGEDAEGEEALWIQIFVDDDASPEELRGFAQTLQREILANPYGLWPYIRFSTPRDNTLRESSRRST